MIYGYFDKISGKIIYDQEKIEKIKKRNVDYLKQHYCNGCIAINHCAGGCIGKMMAETNNLYTSTSDWCAAVRYLYKKLPINNGLFPFLHP